MLSGSVQPKEGHSAEEEPEYRQHSVVPERVQRSTPHCEDCAQVEEGSDVQADPEGEDVLMEDFALNSVLARLVERAKTRTFGVLANEERQMLIRHGYLLALDELLSELTLEEEIHQEEMESAKEREFRRNAERGYQDPFVDEAEREQAKGEAWAKEPTRVIRHHPGLCGNPHCEEDRLEAKRAVDRLAKMDSREVTEPEDEVDLDIIEAQDMVEDY